jgi:hypothetical protein
MNKDVESQKKGLNECGSCRYWKVNFAGLERQTTNGSNLKMRMGYCIGGGFDGSQTQEDETCSLWISIFDRDRIFPIFHEK